MEQTGVKQVLHIGDTGDCGARWGGAQSLVVAGYGAEKKCPGKGTLRGSETRMESKS